MTDALLKALEPLDSAIQEFLRLPLAKGSPTALQQQAACLQKMQAVAAVFAGTRWGGGAGQRGPVTSRCSCRS